MPSSAGALTIGIDARAATEVPAGRGRVARELIRELAQRDDAHRYVLYARERWDHPLDERFEWRLIPSRRPLWNVLVSRDAGRRCNVFLAADYPTVILNRLPTVAVIYDLVAFDRNMSPHRGAMVVERLTLAGAVRRARGLVCISQATADALTARLPYASGRPTVALLGVTPTLLSPPAEELATLPEPGFVLAVGTLEPRKNLARLAAAYTALPPELQAAHPLLVVGARGWQTGPTMEALRSLGDRCVLLGHVSDAALAELYRRCAVFCYPSLGEGFGLPVLEAMSAGAPVVTSNVTSLPEVAGDAAEYVDPHSVQSITDALKLVLESPERREELAGLGRARSAGFTWARTAGIVVRALEQAAHLSGSSGTMRRV